MKRILLLIIILLPIASGICQAAKLKQLPDASDTQSMVTAVSITNESEGTITISGEDSPFVVTASTTIVVDGHPATLRDVHKGMQVLTHTMADSSAPEIDLKTVHP